METFFYNITVEEPREVLVEQSVVNDSQLATNDTDGAEEQAIILPAFRTFIIVLYVLVIVLALLGNGCVIYLVLSQRQMRSVTNYFIASLATSDALMALVCIPITFIANVLVDSWPFPAWMCPFATYFQIVIVFQNAYTLMAISLERYIAVMYPFKQRLTMCQCYLIIALTWFMSFGTPIPTAVVSRLMEWPTEDPNVTQSRCYENWPSEEQLFTYSMTIMVLQYFVPLAVLTYTYIRIVIVVWLKDTPPHGQMGGSTRSAQQRRGSSAAFDVRTGTYVDPRKRIIKMMIAVVGIYATCWLPIHLITILGDTNPDIWENEFMRYVWLSAHWLAMSSCTYNPLIYWWMSERFRWGYKFILLSIKYRCCNRGRSHDMAMNGRWPTYANSYSQGHDYYPARFSRAERDGCGAVAERGGGDQRANGAKAEGAGENAVGDGCRWREEREGTLNNVNGVTFHCDLIVDKGETIPLRKTSDPNESGLGSENGDESEGTCPTLV